MFHRAVRARAVRYLACVLHALLGPFLYAAPAAGPSPAYETSLRAMRWQEDWSWVPAGSSSTLALKRLHAGPEDDWTFTLGGETRLRSEARDETDFGWGPEGSLATANLRLLLHVDANLGERVGAFAQLGTWDQRGRDVPRLFDSSDAVLQRMFVDVRLTPAVTLRVGRQDLFGVASRLLIPVDVFNAQLVHDAVTLQYRQGSVRAQAFAGQRFYPDAHAFGDTDLGRANLAGAFYERGFEALPGVDVGAYWLGEQADVGLFPRRRGAERRRTAILRASYRGSPLRGGIEVGHQRGERRGRGISAWAFASEVTRELALAGKPALTLRVDGASGDGGGATDQGWATLHPVMAYLGRGGDYAASNAVAVYPELAVDVAPSMRLAVAGEVVWRANDRAAFANAGGVTVLPAGARGSGPLLEGGTLRLRWTRHERFDVQGELTWLGARGALREAGGKDRTGATVSMNWRF